MIPEREKVLGSVGPLSPASWSELIVNVGNCGSGSEIASMSGSLEQEEVEEEEKEEEEEKIVRMSGSLSDRGLATGE